MSARSPLGPSPPWRRDEGAVVAEFAVALPVVVLLVALVLGVGRVATVQLDCIDAARAGARAAARGESGALVRATATAAAPGAEVRVSRTATTVVVEVGSSVRPVGLGFRLRVSSRAVAGLERSVAS